MVIELFLFLHTPLESLIVTQWADFCTVCEV